MTHLKLLALALSLIVASCGGDDDKDKAAAPVVTYSTVRFADAPSPAETASLELTQVQACTVDKSGGFTGRFASGATGPLLEVRIKGFSSAGGTYNCTQATDNRGTSEDKSLGLEFDQCGVKVRTVPRAGSTTFNSYATYRDDTAIFDFTYTDACTVTITYDNPKVTGTVQCAKMAQTHREGSPRNPVEASVNITIADSSEFFCNLQQL